MSKQFHNAYNFIPFAKASNKAEIEATKVSLHANQISHDKWHKNKLSGELHCSLHALTPIAYGNQTKGESPRTLLPYKHKGQDAIAANSIRGLLTQNIEILSGSAAKHLSDQTLTFRDSRAKTQPAVGVLTVKDNALHIQPLGLSPQFLKRDKDGKYFVPHKWHKVFVDTNNKLLTLGDCIAITTPKKNSDKLKNSFVNHQGWQNLQDTYCTWPNTLTEQPINAPFTQRQLSSGHIKTTTVGKYKTQEQTLTRESSLNDQNKQYQVAIKANASFTGARHMMFNIEGAYSKTKPLTLSKEVIKTYKDILLSTAGYAKFAKDNTSIPDDKLDGCIVFFDVTHQNGNDIQPEIDSIFDSQLWRGKLNDSVHDFFELNQLPYAQQPERKLSVAEQLLGVISQKKQANSVLISAYKSRISVSDAIFSGPAYSDTTYKLPLMSSPKLPCPAMYFSVNGRAQNVKISKHQLNAGQHVPNGRKVYLRHEQAKGADLDIGYSNDEQDKNRTRCNLIEQHAQASFKVKFTNLSPEELELLVTALAPSNQYIHQIGGAKPYGYGQSKIAIEQILLETFESRYQLSSLLNNHYQQATIENYYQQALALTQNQKSPSLIVEQAKQLLVQIGEFQSRDIEYPTAPKFDRKSQQTINSVFQWFVNNDHNKVVGGHQTLPLLKDDIKPMQTNKIDGGNNQRRGNGGKHKHRKLQYQK